MTTEECEFCAQPPGPRRVIERPMADEVKALSKFFWVVDPSRLVFCDEECRVKWHALRRRSLWERHGPSCHCVECMGR